MKALSQKEVISIIRAAKTTRDKAMICCAYRHGLRCSEVCGLRLEDVDLKNNEIVVRRLKGSLTTTQPIVDQAGEPCLSEKRMLNAWLRERGDHPSAFVFTSQKSGRCNRSTFFRVFNEAAREAGLPQDRRHPHCLKHALGTNLSMAGVDLAKIRIALGHRNVSSTAIYCVPTDAAVGKEVTRALLSLG
jgi:type 1 fimbriae regulatory protein FimB